VRAVRGTAFALLLGAACVQRQPAPPGPAFDRQLRERIELRLSIDHGLCPYAIRVVVYGGTAELSGLVDGTLEQRRAEKIARDAGAARVVDHLERSLSSGDPGRC
jgi:osmotically-inducible protein OsmY